jgi:hypothetical protein
MAIDYPFINGVRHEWSSVEIKLKGQIYVGIKSISYSDKLEPTKLRGTHPQAIGRTRGEYDCEASIEMYLAEANELRKALGAGYKEIAFDIVVAYSEDGLESITDEIIGCRIKSEDGGGSQGPDALVKKFDLDVMLVRWNGLDSLKSPLSPPAT